MPFWNLGFEATQRLAETQIHFLELIFTMTFSLRYLNFCSFFSSCFSACLIFVIYFHHLPHKCKPDYGHLRTDPVEGVLSYFSYYNN